MKPRKDFINRMHAGGELIIGAHLSIAGGMHKAFERGFSLNCRVIQIFLKNSTQWRARTLTEQDVILFRAARQKSGIGPVLAHSSYLINLASPDPVLQQKSLNAFIDEMRRAIFLGIPYLILHPGSHMGAGVTAGINRVAAALDQAFADVDPEVKLLIETTAGQGTSIGYQFEQLASIIESVHHPERIGICMDTCHIFAAGYDIRTQEGYERTLSKLDSLIGMDRLLAVHVNDSKASLGSRVDRHFHIGRGCIGLDAFRYLMNDSRLNHIPKIIETPKDAGMRADRRNLQVLRRLANTGAHN